MKHIRRWFAGGVIVSLLGGFSLVRYFTSGATGGQTPIHKGKIVNRNWPEV